MAANDDRRQTEASDFQATWRNIIVLLIIAAAASLLIVLVTRSVSGPMSVEFFGLKFHGAASETIMWIACFLAISYAIERTWKLEYTPPANILGGATPG
jgi:hypothetical protein